MVGAAREGRGQIPRGQNQLSEISHMRESMLQLPYFVIKPAVTFLLTDDMRVEQRGRINFSAAFGAFRCAEIGLIK